MEERVREVVVRGGGFVGVETACGIARMRPDVEVSLVHRGGGVCKDMHQEARKEVIGGLRKWRVNILEDDGFDSSLERR